MSGDDLAIFLFFLTCTVALGTEAVKAETFPRRLSFGAIAILCLLTGVFWTQVERALPSLSQQIAVVATNPMSWFVVIMFFLAVLAFHRPRPRLDKPKAHLPDQPRATPEIPPQPRVHTHATASDLLKLFEGRTSVQARVLVENHLNKWMNITGTVKEVDSRDDAATVFLKEGAKGDGGFISARFTGEQANKVIHLTQDSLISVVGRVESVNQLCVALEQCELT